MSIFISYAYLSNYHSSPVMQKNRASRWDTRFLVREMGLVCIFFHIGERKLRFASIELSAVTVHRTVTTYYSSPVMQKTGHPDGIPGFWCERWDSNPHGVTTRTSNVLVYHSNTLASAYVLYRGTSNLSTIFSRFSKPFSKSHFIFMCCLIL